MRWGPKDQYRAQASFTYLEAIVNTPLFEGSCLRALDAEIPFSENPGTDIGLEFPL